VTFTNGSYGPDALLDAAGNALLGAAVEVPDGYTAELDDSGNLTVTGPAADNVEVTVTPAVGVPVTVPVTVAPLVQDVDLSNPSGASSVVARETFLSRAAGSGLTPGLAVGARIRVGDRPLPDLAGDPQGYVKLQAFHDVATGMVIWAQKVEGDSEDVNVDGAIMVKHGKDYAGTPGYADTYQVYALAGSDGLVLGSNNFVGVSDDPYTPTPAAIPNGYVRFELGPLWPYSEKMRLNNQGDLIVGWTLLRKTSCSQSGTTITGTGADFQPTDVGKFLLWGDYENGGKRGFADRITGYSGPGSVTVETSRTIANQAASVRTPKTIITKDGEVQAYAAPTSYTPQLRGSGSNPGLGTNPVQFGRYFDDGNRIRGDVRIKLGAGFTAGAGFYSVTLPVLAHADDVAQNLLVGPAAFYDLSANVTYILAAAVLSTDSLILYVDGSTSALGAAVPVVPAAGDELRVQFDYRRA
jgi:hypothetical protein